MFNFEVCLFILKDIIFKHWRTSYIGFSILFASNKEYIFLPESKLLVFKPHISFT